MALTLTNLSGMMALRYLGVAQQQCLRSMERLSSGLRIVRAADDPAGLAISERMRGQIRGLKQASRNAQDGISLLQTAEGNLTSIQEMIHRLRELSVQAANDTFSEADRAAMQEEFNQLVEEIDATVGRSEFNKIPLFIERERELVLQIGANSGQNMKLKLPVINARVLGLVDEDGNILDISSHNKATNAIEITEKALSTISSSRSVIGAQMNRLGHTINNLETQRENLIAAESRIRDVDYAEEVMNLVGSQIRMQVATAMVAQANLSQQMLLKLLFPTVR